MKLVTYSIGERVNPNY